ncbi:MAG: glycosyltransferase family 2 protein [Desulfobacteraceae bacterium]|nr:glycosyltransferase family 2 protein [Desulfobacteraceae bacterium]MBC2720133.1 glycosyltransferase family 2 protein [Desulfobacteraceae bacterium]
MHKQQIAISIVCPFFNEEKMVDLFMKEITAVVNELNKPFEVVCVNDGSTDNTLAKLLQAKEDYPNMKIINFSRNFGKEAALTAGLDYAKGEMIIPIDADLQDPPELIKDFISYREKGYDVVVAKRVDRSTDSILKKTTAQLFYKLHNKIAQTKIPDNVGDYRLITRKVLNAMQELRENQRFMKGIFAWVGFKTATVEYKRNNRKAGKTSYNGWKLWNFALDGITSFSNIPLRIWLYIGTFISFLTFLYGSFIIARTLIWGVDVPGYASLLTVILFLGGIQLIGIGALGEYIGRIYMESKKRPLYIVEDEY